MIKKTSSTKSRNAPGSCEQNKTTRKFLKDVLNQLLLRFCKTKLTACWSSNEEKKRKYHTELKEDYPYLGLLESRQEMGDGETKSSAEDTN